MLTTCSLCGMTYDDRARWTICPHLPLMSREELEQKDTALAMLGKEVRFAHQTEGPWYLVQSISYCGMVSLAGMTGEFAPHIFVVKEEPRIKYRKGFEDWVK